jgi:hypothetical protein
VTYRNRNVGSNLYRGSRPMEAHPWHAEHSPCANRLYCPLPCNFSSAKLDTIVVYVVSDWHGGSGRSDIRVREARALLLRNETSNLIFRGFRQAEQGDRNSLPEMRISYAVGSGSSFVRTKLRTSSVREKCPRLTLVML